MLFQSREQGAFLMQGFKPQNAIVRFGLASSRSLSQSTRLPAGGQGWRSGAVVMVCSDVLVIGLILQSLGLECATVKDPFPLQQGRALNIFFWKALFNLGACNAAEAVGYCLVA